VGGGMRQSGILAAAALYALHHHVERLTEDHANAKRLARGLATMPGIIVDPDAVDTNMVFLRFEGIEGPPFQAALAERGVLASRPVSDALRMVTHLDVSADEIEEAIARATAAAESLVGA